MPATSLIKFINEADSKGRKLHWGRVDVDGVPYRGDQPPTGTEDELQESLIKAPDAQVRIFDLDDVKDTHEYTELLNKVAAGWAQLLVPRHHSFNTDREGKLHVTVYCEWSTPVMIDGRPMMSQKPLIGRPNE